MKFPDFSESQLQQLYNDSFANIWPVKLPGYFIPVLINTRQEKDKGYDTGFKVPWIDKFDPNNKMCNLFIQYKLANLCDHSSSGQYQYWNQPYFRFSIPHETASYGGIVREYSYHQFNALKSLADQGYSVNYCANSTINDWQLFEWYSNGLMTKMNPIVDITEIDEDDSHRYITFTEKSSYFLQHSEPREINKIFDEKLLSRIEKGKLSSMKEDLDIIPDILLKIPSFEEHYSYYRDISYDLSIIDRWTILHFFVSSIFDVTWFKIPSSRKRN